MLLKLEGEQVIVTMQRNDFRQMLMHCMGLTNGRYDEDHLRRISEILWNYFNGAEEIEEHRSRALRR